MTCTKHMHMHDEEVASLESGPHGLVIAKFEDSVHTTELSNLMLAGVAPVKGKRSTKKPAAAAATAAPAAPAPAPAAAVLKKPAAAISKGKPAAADAVVPGGDYTLMHYGTKGNNSIGIRAKFGLKAQVLSFGGKLCTKSKAEMLVIGEELVADLQAGMSCVDAKKKGMTKCGL